MSYASPRTRSRSSGPPSWLLAIARAAFVVRAGRLTAEDVLSELLVLLLSHDHTPRDAQGFPTGALAQERARWGAIDLYRRVVRTERREIALPEGRELGVSRSADESRVDARRTLRTLSVRAAQSEPLDRRLMEGRLARAATERELAEETGLSPASVHRRLRRLFAVG